MQNINIQWFPGHMTKTKRRIQANLKLVDAVVEIIDARIPVSSRNPDLDKLIQNKPRIILMNKCLNCLLIFHYFSLKYFEIIYHIYL